MWMREKALGLLGIAQKGGNVEIGEDPVGQVSKAGTARLIILAADAADHTVRKARSFAARHDTPLITVDGTKDTLGAVFGRTSVAMLALTDIALSQRFLELLEDPEHYGAVLTAVREKAEIMKKRKQERQRRNRKQAAR